MSHEIEVFFFGSMLFIYSQYILLIAYFFYVTYVRFCCDTHAGASSGVDRLRRATRPRTPRVVRVRYNFLDVLYITFLYMYTLMHI